MQVFGTAGARCFTIEVRCVGPNTYEARCEDGRLSAIGQSERDAVFALMGTGKVPSHREAIVVRVPLPHPRPESES